MKRPTIKLCWPSKPNQKKNTMIFSRLEACETEDARTFSSRPISKFRRLPRTCRMWTWRVDHQSFDTPTNLPTGMFHHHHHHHLGPLGPDLGGLDSFWGKGYDILREIFPDWQTLSTETEPCAVCEAAMHIAREDKRGIKKQAEDEKVRGCTFSFFFLSFDRTCGWTCAHRTIIGKVETHLG